MEDTHQASIRSTKRPFTPLAFQPRECPLDDQRAKLARRKRLALAAFKLSDSVTEPKLRTQQKRVAVRPVPLTDAPRVLKVHDPLFGMF